MLEKVVTDTGTLWSVDASTHPEYEDRLHVECLLRLIDTALHPERSLTCLIPSLQLGEGEDAFLPETFRAFRSVDLISVERSVDARDVLPTTWQLDQMLTLLTRWYENSPSYANSYLALHLHGQVRWGWAHRVPDEGVPVNWRGIPLYIYDFYQSRSVAFARLEAICGWSAWEVSFLFSIVARGFQYGIAAHRIDAKYQTHPIRWLGAAGRVETNLYRRPSTVPVANIIYTVWKEGRFSHDLQYVANVTAQISAAAREDKIYMELLQAAHDREGAADRLRELTKRVLPARPSERTISTLNKSAEHVATLTGAAAVKSTGDVLAAASGLFTSWYLKSWVELIENCDIAPSVARLPLIRDHVRYGGLMALESESCPRCGSLWVGRSCSVCDILPLNRPDASDGPMP